MFWVRTGYLLLFLSRAFPAAEPLEKLLQAGQLLEQSGLQDGLTQLQVEGAAGQDERRVAVEALQDVSCREEREELCCSV